MKTLLAAGFALLALVPPQAGQPINAMCPVKPRQKSRASLTVVYEGQVIGLCCASCVERFKENPKAFAATIPEFQERAVVGIQSAAGYEEGRPLGTSW